MDRSLTVLLLLCALVCVVSAQTKTVYVGGMDTHITILDWDVPSGKLSIRGTAKSANNPNFLAIHPNRKHLYAVSDGTDGNGAVEAFNINGDKSLQLVNNAPAGGDWTTFIRVTQDAKLLVANYGGPNNGHTIAVFNTTATGAVGSRTFLQLDQGHGPNKDRQATAHPHQFIVDPQNRFAFSMDLGNDKVYQFVWRSNGTPTPNTPSSLDQAPGTGPRHLAFHPSSKFAYLVSELANLLTIFDYNASNGTLSKKATLNTVPPPANSAQTTVAEVAVSKDGNFLYVSNRAIGNDGSNSLVVYKIRPDTGLVDFVEYQNPGNTPRFFVIDDDGKSILVANQDSNNVVAYAINVDTGKLTRVGASEYINTPTTIVIN